MIEEKVDRVILPADLQAILPPDEGEPDAELHEELFQLVDQRAFEIAFPGLGAEPEKIEVIGVFQELLCQLRLRALESPGKVAVFEGIRLALVQAAVDLVVQHPLGPPVSERLLAIPEGL